MRRNSYQPTTNKGNCAIVWPRTALAVPRKSRAQPTERDEASHRSHPLTLGLPIYMYVQRQALGQCRRKIDAKAVGSPPPELCIGVAARGLQEMRLQLLLEEVVRLDTYFPDPDVEDYTEEEESGKVEEETGGVRREGRVGERGGGGSCSTRECLCFCYWN